MADSDAVQELRQWIQPVLVGNTREAHRLAAAIFRRFEVISLIFGKCRVYDLFDINSRTHRIRERAHGQLQCEQLIHLADNYPDTVLLLIPCSEAAEHFLGTYAATLESRYILTDRESLFSSSPLSDIEAAQNRSL